MPIELIDCGKIEDVLYLNFDGSGDIRICTAKSEEDEEALVHQLTFHQSFPNPIGKSMSDKYVNKSLDTFADEEPVKVVLDFTKPESVQVVIDALVIIKTSLEKHAVN